MFLIGVDNLATILPQDKKSSILRRCHIAHLQIFIFCLLFCLFVIFVLGTTVDPFLTCLEQGACNVAVSYSALVILILFVACLAAP